jgi:3-vinyl bacteriochlorophyllide hydratase
MVQAVLAPLQFAACFVSALLILRYFLTGDGYLAATASILVKTVLLAAIMVTGSIWEKVVFGRYLFAPAFFWEDAVSMIVVTLHVAYVAALLSGALDAPALLALALLAYAAYVLNAGQFLMKLRAARVAPVPA